MNGTREEMEVFLMLTCLQAAVPLWAAEAAAWGEQRFHDEARDAGDLLAHGADVLFRPDDSVPRSAAERLAVPTVVTLTKEQAEAGVKARGYRPAEVFNAIAKALGIGASLPGGVTWMGKHWCTAPHKGCGGTIRLRSAA